MGRYKKTPTKEQIEFRNLILNKKVKINQISGPKIGVERDKVGDKICEHLYYIDNCVWHINQYVEVHQSRLELLGTIRSMKDNIIELEATLVHSLSSSKP